MNILKLNIDNFGKFTKKEINLKEGLNIVFGNNETGKSTIIDFIYLFLYYHNNKDYLKYLPWDSGSFGRGNSILISLDNNQKILIEKNLNSKETNIYDYNNFKEITSNYPIEKGKISFMEDMTGMSFNTFKACALVKQSQSVINKSMKKDLQEKLLNLAKYGDEDLNYEKALEMLDKRKDKIGTGKSGKHKELVKINNKISELEVKRNKAYNIISKLYNLEENKKDLNERLQKIKRSLNHINVLIENKETSLKSEYENIKEQISNIEENKKDKIRIVKNFRLKYGHKKENVKYIQETINSIKEIERYIENERLRSEKIKQKLYDRKNLKKTDSTYNKDIKKSLIQDRLKALKTNMVFSIITTSIIIISALLISQIYGSFNYLWYLTLGIIPVTGIIFYFYINNLKSVIKDYENKYNQTGKEKDNNNMLTTLLDESDRQIKQYQSKREEYFNKLHDFLKELKYDIKDKDILKIASNYIYESNKVDELAKEINILNEKLQYLYTNLETYKEFFDVNKEYKAYSNNYNNTKNKQELEKEKDKLISSQKELEINLNSIKKEIELLQNNYSHPGDIQEEIDKLSQKKKKLEEEREQIDIAKDYLKLAASDIQKNIIPELNSLSYEVFSEITGHDETQDFILDSSLDIKVKRNNVIPASNLSYSTIEQLYLSLRIGMLKLFSRKETIPLILDEPFAYYDDVRVKNIINYLVNISEKNQIIIFTCQRKDINILNKVSNNFKLIDL